MNWLVIAGIVLTLAGLGCLIYCVLKAVRISRSDADEDTRKAALQRLVAVNAGGVALSAFGLIFVIFGLLF